MLGSPNTTLHGRSTNYYWEGPGLLSVKTFTRGRARYQAGGGHFAVDDSNYLILNHGQEYSITIEATKPIESFCVFFTAGLAEEVQASITLTHQALLDHPASSGDGPVSFVERTYPRTASFMTTFENLRSGRLQGEREDEAYRLLLATLLQVHAGTRREMEAVSAARPATREELYRRLYLARDYAESFLERTVTLQEMASIAGLSPNHLLRTFRDVFGCTPHQYIVNRRMAHARGLLANTDLPVTEVCFAAGFQSPGSFSSLFRRLMGCAPIEYRRSTR
jgi:AraC-like DNA-binding protein